MRPRRTHIYAASIALLAIAMLVSAQAALAAFTHTATGGPLTLVTAKLAPPTNAAATQVNCRFNKSPEIEVSWTATSSTYASTYTIERATLSAGPYTALASVPSSETNYADKSGTLASSTTYYYRVSASYRSWSATSTTTAIKTLSKSCLS